MNSQEFVEGGGFPE